MRKKDRKKITKEYVRKLCKQSKSSSWTDEKKTQTCRKMFKNTRIHICTKRTCVLLWMVFCRGCDVHRVDDGLNLCICELIYKQGQSHAYCDSIRTECLVDVVPHTVKATIWWISLFRGNNFHKTYSCVLYSNRTSINNYT